MAFEQIGIISEIVRHLCDSEAASIKYKQMLVNHHKSSHNTVESSLSPELDAQNEKKTSEEEASRSEKDRLKLEENCALAIYKCAANKLTRDMVRQSGGLDPLCRLIQSDNIRSNKNLLAAVTGAIWKCAISPENVSRFNQNSLVASLVPLLEENEDDQVLANVVGALAECCVDPANRHVLRINNGLPKLVSINIFKK